MRLVYGNDALWAGWVAQRIPAMHGSTSFGPSVAIGVVDKDGWPMGAVIFHNYHPEYRTVELSMASDSSRWLTKSLISGILAYPFQTLKVGRITAITAPREVGTSIVRFLETFGFRLEGRVRKGLGDHDALVWGLLDTEWKWHRYNLLRPVGFKGGSVRHGKEDADPAHAGRSGRHGKRPVSGEHRNGAGTTTA